MSSGLHEQVLLIFADVFQTDLPPDVQDVTRSELAAWDSISHFRLVSELEQTFAISLSDDEVLGLTSLNDIKDLLARRGLV